MSEKIRVRPIVRLQRTRSSGAGPGGVDLALQEIGCTIRRVHAASLEPSADEIVFAVGSASWYPAAWRRLLSVSRAQRPPVILWHSEPLPFATASGLRTERRHARELAKIVLRDPRATDPQTNFKRLRGLLERGLPDLLVVTTLEKQEFLEEKGIEATFVPLGYHPSHGRDLHLERDIEVLFLGSLDVPRRKQLLRGLRRAGIEAAAVGGWGDPAFWDENRTRLLNRAKILLNLPRHPGLLSGMRMILGMANKALVISEPVHRPAPYEAGVHYVSASPEEMPETIRRYLADEDERTRITDTAYRFVTEELTMTSSVTRILALIEARL